MKSFLLISTLFQLLSLSSAFLAPEGSSFYVVTGTNKRCSYNANSGIIQHVAIQEKIHVVRKQKQSFFQMKKMKSEANNEKKTTSKGWLEKVKEKPGGTLIIAPFVAIFFLDLVANILVVTKRTIEYALTGQYTVWHF